MTETQERLMVKGFLLTMICCALLTMLTGVILISAHARIEQKIDKIQRQLDK